MIEALRRRIPEDAFTFNFARSSGPGGQNVNKVSTRVTLLFDLKGTTALSEEQKRRIRTKLRGRISKEGFLRVVSMRHRTQRANRKAATDRFYEVLAEVLSRPKPRRATGIPARVRRERLRQKRLRGELKKLRGTRPEPHSGD
jgi:ribosome-associated protein